MEQLRINFFCLSKFITEIIDETPTGGHYDKRWWSSRYTDLQNEQRIRTNNWRNTTLDFTFQDLFDEVLKYFKGNEMALYFLNEDEEE